MGGWINDSPSSFSMFLWNFHSITTFFQIKKRCTKTIHATTHRILLLEITKNIFSTFCRPWWRCIWFNFYYISFRSFAYLLFTYLFLTAKDEIKFLEMEWVNEWAVGKCQMHVSSAKSNRKFDENWVLSVIIFASQKCTVAAALQGVTSIESARNRRSFGPSGDPHSDPDNPIKTLIHILDTPSLRPSRDPHSDLWELIKTLETFPCYMLFIQSLKYYPEL